MTAKIINLHRGTCPEPSPLAATDSPRHVENRRGEPRPDMIEKILTSPSSGSSEPDEGHSR